MKLVGYAAVFGVTGAMYSFSNHLFYLGGFCTAIALVGIVGIFLAYKVIIKNNPKK